MPFFFIRFEFSSLEFPQAVLHLNAIKNIQNDQMTSFIKKSRNTHVRVLNSSERMAVEL